MAYITPPEQLDGSPRRIQWTCRFCGHTFTRWTRRGLRVTCNKCGRVQEGPAGVARMAARLEKKQTSPKPTQALTIVAVNGSSQVKTKAKPAVAPAVKKKAAAPPPPPAPVTPKKDLLSRVMGF